MLGTGVRMRCRFLKCSDEVKGTFPRTSYAMQCAGGYNFPRFTDEGYNSHVPVVTGGYDSHVSTSVPMKGTFPRTSYALQCAGGYSFPTFHRPCPVTPKCEGYNFPRTSYAVQWAGGYAFPRFTCVKGYNPAYQL